MTELTPRNLFPYPSEREEPFYDSFKSGQLAVDAAVWANSDNTNVQFIGGGTFSWNAGTNFLFWTDQVQVNGFHTPFGAYIPAGSMTIQEDEVVYFQMPRMVQSADQSVTLYRASRIFLQGARLHDLRLFCVRKDNTLYFSNGRTLKDGDVGTLFGSGLLPLMTVLPHTHAPAFVYVAPAAGITVINPTPTYTLPDLFRVDVFRNGQLLAEGPDYSVDYSTGAITLTVATVVVPNPDQFVVWRELRDASVTVSSHQHASKLILNPAPGTSVLNALSTSPFLLRVDVFKNGQLLAEGGSYDYTIDLGTGLITLVVPSVLNDRFEIFRELGI